MMKKLALTLFAFVSFLANAYDFAVDGIYYNVMSLPDLTVEVTSGDTKYTGDVVIPQNVTFKDRQFSVVAIHNSAFQNCSRLISVNIPNSVTEIGNSAFYGCSSLISINIPNSVTKIGFATFRDCSRLISVNIPISVTEIERFTFDGCRSLTSINIPNSVTEIGYDAFSRCSSLTSINIPNSVTTIRSDAFYECSSLISVNIPNSVTYIGDAAFKNCTSITSLSISKNLTELNVGTQGDTFENCKNIKYLHFNDSEEAISFNHGSKPFYDLNLVELYLGRPVKPSSSFKYPTSLKKITFGPLLEELGDFYGNVNSIPPSTEIYCMNPNPPSFGTLFGNSQYINNTVFVPIESLEAYKQAEGWKNFWDIRGDDFDSGVAITPMSQSHICRVYNLQGVLVLETANKNDINSLPAGIYIVNGEKIRIQ